MTACRQVAHGSLQASTRKVHRPGSSATTVPANRSVPSPTGAIRTCCAAPRLPTFFQTTLARDGVVALAPDRGLDRARPRRRRPCSDGARRPPTGGHVVDTQPTGHRLTPHCAARELRTYPLAGPSEPVRPAGQFTRWSRGTAGRRVAADSPGPASCRLRPGGRRGWTDLGIAFTIVSRVRALRRFTVRAQLPAPLAPLQTLATNLRWSWHPPTQDLFAGARPGGLGAGRARPGAAARRDLLGPARRAGQGRRHRGHRAASWPTTCATYLSEPRWYQSEREDDPSLPAAIGYFSMEFGVTEVLPNYSGGLGVLAGDHLKAASDLGVPLIGVGLLYRSATSGSRCRWTAGSWSSTRCSTRRGCRCSCSPTPTGEPVLVEVAMPGGRTLRARVWQAAGRPGAAAAARLRHRGERAGPARRHRPALRRRPGPPHPAGDPGRHRRGAGGARVTAR